MSVKVSCDVEECGWFIVSDEGSAMRAFGRHEAKTHPAIAEANFIAANPDSQEPRPIEAREPGCICLPDAYDPDCSVHLLDANW